MKLGKYFTLEELVHTNTGLANEPSPNAKLNLTELVKNVLDPAREELGSSIKINSGFRCPAVNAKVGGAATSQHVKGEAADLDCGDNAKLFNIIKDNFVFDQLINENNYSWIHVSYKTQGNRCEVLEFKNGKYVKL